MPAHNQQSNKDTNRPTAVGPAAHGRRVQDDLAHTAACPRARAYTTRGRSAREKCFWSRLMGRTTMSLYTGLIVTSGTLILDRSCCLSYIVYRKLTKNISCFLDKVSRVMVADSVRQHDSPKITTTTAAGTHCFFTAHDLASQQTGLNAPYSPLMHLLVASLLPHLSPRTTAVLRAPTSPPPPSSLFFAKTQ